MVIFVHGSGAIDANAYLAWIEHFVQRRAVVIFPLYQRTTYDETENPADPAWTACAAPLETLEQEGVLVDPSRVAVVGHSLGGVLGSRLRGERRSRGIPGANSGDGRCSPVVFLREVACLERIRRHPRDDPPSAGEGGG